MTASSTPSLLVRLQSLAQRLYQAGSTHDWTAVETADRALADLLRGLAGQPLGSAERSALQQLRLLHDQIVADCELRLDELRETLSQMQQHRAGWGAYAESQDWSPEMPQ